MYAAERSGLAACYGTALVLLSIATSGQASAENDVCGTESIFLGPTGSYHLKSPHYPSDVNTTIHCNWTVTATPGSKIKLIIHDLHISHYRDSFTVANLHTLANTSADYVLKHFREVKVQMVMSTGHVVGVKLLAGSDGWADYDSAPSGRRFWLELEQVLSNASLISECSNATRRFLCENRNICVDHSGRCDALIDCPDQSDERNCPHSCPRNEYCANSNACLTRRFHCDGIDDCSRAEDEQSCDVRLCPKDCSCQVTPVNALLIVNCSNHPNLTNVWDELPRIMKKLILRKNNITDLEPGRFQKFSHLATLDLEDNQLTRLKRGYFSGLSKLILLKTNKNHLNTIDSGVFQALESLTFLRLDENNITSVREEMFKGLNGLQTLRLGTNRIRELKANTFRHLNNLLSLDLVENQISSIEPHAFRGLGKLRNLQLRENLLTVLQTDMFSHLKSLEILTFENNPWTVIEPGALNGLDSLQILALSRHETEAKDFTVDKHELEHMSDLRFLVVDDQRMCCLVDYRPNGIRDNCVLGSRPDYVVSLSYFTCDRLMHNSVLRVFVWCLGISALFGNTFIILWRLKMTDSGKRSQSVLILNLAVSDLIMGAYMLIIAGADAYFKDTFFLHVEGWRSGHLCNFAGFLSMLSSEASVFFITMISIDRFLCVVFPFGKKWLRLDTARVASLAMWCTALLISIPPLLLQDKIDGFYGLSDVCVGLPLVKSNRTSKQEDRILLGETQFNGTVKESATPSRAFSVTVYLGINLVCCVVVLLCYLAIAFVVIVKLPSKKLQKRKDKEHRKKEMAMARRMLLIVGTDFCCWMPVILMGILSMSGAVDIPDETYAWVVVFVIPINSSLNPYLYTFSNSSTVSLTCCKFRTPGSSVNSVKMKPLASTDTKDVSQRCRSGTHTFL
ncbi:G-protein coupled receptor GRL101-like isoform X2 [Acanthaster planci]|uniref:G-protein coupled receptor GRL101-like isoform X2 n=1 Tax=Acanthaster planci TaxID=133434 RepID=A0A8B7Z1K6_ACAPL|nr:G-protein coupled receptor GRL101-like isoform X2 [Acanthaster planci]